MVDAHNHWSARATRGPALTVLALASLASFGHGLFGRGDLLLSPPLREPASQVLAEAPPPPPAVDPLLPEKPAAVVVATREGARPEPARADETAGAEGAEDPALALATAAAEAVAPADPATTPAAVESGVPAAEVAPAPVEPLPEVETPPLRGSASRP